MRLDGQKLRQLRENQGLTLVQLARLAQLSKSQLSYLERGQRGATPPAAARLAQALGVAIADLRRDTAPSLRDKGAVSRRERFTATLDGDSIADHLRADVVSQI